MKVLNLEVGNVGLRGKDIFLKREFIIFDIEINMLNFVFKFIVCILLFKYILNFEYVK